MENTQLIASSGVHGNAQNARKLSLAAPDPLNCAVVVAKRLFFLKTCVSRRRERHCDTPGLEYLQLCASPPRPIRRYTSHSPGFPETRKVGSNPACDSRRQDDRSIPAFGSLGWYFQSVSALCPSYEINKCLASCLP